MKKIIIIGAGLGGLSAACRLAHAGHDVTVVERAGTVGGKVNFVGDGGYKFDTGASLLTMRDVIAGLFEDCGRSVDDYLDIVPLEPICRYFWSDGTRFDASQDIAETERGIAAIEPRDVDGFRRYLADSREKYDVSMRTFLASSLNDFPRVVRTANFSDLFKLSAIRSLDAHNAKFFKSPKLRQLFNRFATYNGSSPYSTPATFALIPYVEFGLGAWYVRGGMYEIPKALARLATELGVVFRLSTDVERIAVENGRACGVVVGEETIAADIVVSNADAIETYRSLLPVKKFQSREPSCSGFVLLLGTNRRYEQLAHHNIFFSDDYKAEFDAIFRDRVPSKNPTIYVCATSRTDDTQAPRGHENLFVLINAPYLTENIDWEKEKRAYRDLIVAKLEALGLDGLGDAIDFEEIITPRDFELKYRANKGSIYGISSNGIFSAFMRVPNKSREIDGLYFVGGATHPGGGIPLVLLSGKMAAEMIAEREKS